MTTFFFQAGANSTCILVYPILCRPAFKGLSSGGEGSVQFVNSRLRSRQPLLKRSKAILLSVKYLYFAHQMCPLSIFDLGFFRNVLLRSIGQFSLNSFTRFHFPALPSCCIWHTCVPKSLNSLKKSIRKAG